jgi:hypothetical protein
MMNDSINRSLRRPQSKGSVSQPLNLLAIARSPLSWGMVLVMVYTMVAVGRIQEVFSPLAKIRVGLLTGGLALLVWVVSSGSLREKIPLQSKPVRYVMILFGLAVLTVPIAVWPGGSFHYLTAIYMKIIVLFLLVLYWCRSVQDVRRMIWACAVAAVILVIAGALTGSIQASRIKDSSESYDANDLALLLDIMLPLALYLFATSTWLLRMVLAGMMLVFLYGLVLTQSRGGFLALLAVGALVLRRSALKRSHKIAFTSLAILVFGLIAGKAYWERIETMWAPKTEYDRTAGGRTELWKTGLGLLAKRPWGVGIDGFAVAEGLSHGGKGKWSAAHNSFLQVAVELGVAGFVVFVLVLLSTFKTLRQVQLLLRPPPDRKATPRIGRAPLVRAPLLGKPKKQLDVRENILLLASALEVSLCGFAVGGFFLSQAYSGMLYVLLGLSVVCMRLADAYQSVGDQRTSQVLASPRRSPQRVHYAGPWPGPAKPPQGSFGGGRWKAAGQESN